MIASRSATKAASLLLLLAGADITQQCDAREPAATVIEHKQITLRNVVAQFRLEERFSPRDSVAKRKLKDGVVMNGLFVSDWTFRFLEGKAYYERLTLKEPDEIAALGGANLRIDSFPGDRVESLQKRKSGETGGTIEAAGAHAPPDALLDIALGFIAWQGQEFIAPDLWRQLTCTETENEIRFERKRTAGSKDVWIFDPRQEHALVKYELKSDDFVSFQALADDFRRVGPALLPHRITARNMSRPHGKPHVSKTCELSVSRYRLDDPANTPSSYNIVWPLGATVLDARVKQSFKITSRPKPIEDEEINRVIEEHQSSSQIPERRWWLIGLFAFAGVALSTALWWRRWRVRKTLKTSASGAHVPR